MPLEFRSLLRIEYYTVLSLAESPYALSTRDVQREVIRHLGRETQGGIQGATNSTRKEMEYVRNRFQENEAAAIKAIKKAGLPVPSYNRIDRTLEALHKEGWIQEPRTVSKKKEGAGWFLTEAALTSIKKSGVKK